MNAKEITDKLGAYDCLNCGAIDSVQLVPIEYVGNPNLFTVPRMARCEECRKHYNVKWTQWEINPEDN